MRRFTRLVLIMTVILSLAGTVQAQGLVGKKAPPLNAKEWINAEEGLTLEKLKGKIIFLEFTATW